METRSRYRFSTSAAVGFRGSVGQEVDVQFERRSAPAFFDRLWHNGVQPPLEDPFKLPMMGIERAFLALPMWVRYLSGPALC